MRIIKASTEILNEFTLRDACLMIEVAARTCYKSEDLTTEDSANKLVRSLVRSGHEAMLEHVSVSARVICDRGVSHEIVRHRIASYAQESTRYCNYSRGKFNNEITVIEPCFWEEGSEQYSRWKQSCVFAEDDYLGLIEMGATPQEARSVLPNSLKTEIIMTMNIREWRHFFKLRYKGITGKPHPQMIEISSSLFKQFKNINPIIVEDIE